MYTVTMRLLKHNHIMYTTVFGKIIKYKLGWDFSTNAKHLKQIVARLKYNFISIPHENEVCS